MSESQNYKAAVTTVGGDVFVALPDDAYIQMTPGQARKVATRLFFKAAEAEGDAPPQIIVFKDEGES